jgi:hypothetical protein
LSEVKWSVRFELVFDLILNPESLILLLGGAMPLYVSAHTTACLTKQSAKELMLRMMNSKEVNVTRCLCSQIGGRMLTEVESPDQPTLEKFFRSQHMNCEWIMRIDLEAKDGAMVEY